MKQRERGDTAKTRVEEKEEKRPRSTQKLLPSSFLPSSLADVFDHSEGHR